MRCSRASLDRHEPQAGTASTVTSFLLVEWAGSWGVDAPRDSRLPAAVKRWMAAQRGMRPLLLRRGRPDRTRVFACRAGELSSVELDDVHLAASLDLDRDLEPHDGRLYLVCTHGRHDACCAERGRPLFHALAEAAPEETWQVSHIGGDRFAANVLVLPEGLYYGRLTPADAAGFVAEHRAGRLDLTHLRGRTSYPFPVQAADIFLREALGERRIEPLRLRAQDESVVVFEVDGRQWRVEVRRTTTRELLTCRATTPSGGWTFELVSLSEVS